MRLLEEQLAVGDILDHGHGETELGQQAPEQALVGLAQASAGGIREIADEVDRLDALGVGAGGEIFQEWPQRVLVQAAGVVVGQRHRARAEFGDHVEEGEVARPVHEHDVARVAQRLHGDVERLLRAVGDEEAAVVGVGVEFRLPEAQARGQLPAQARAALGGAVLEVVGQAGPGRYRRRRRERTLHRQRGVVGETGGQREQVLVLHRQADELGDGGKLGALAGGREAEG